MPCCCKNIWPLCFVDACAENVTVEIPNNQNVTMTGAILKFQFLNTQMQIPVNYWESGAATFTIPSKYLNENYCYEAEVTLADGMGHEFIIKEILYNCVSFCAKTIKQVSAAA